MTLVYEPAEDSYLLASIIPNYVKNKSVLDVGTGSGILAKTAKDANAKSVLSIDINSEAIKILKQKKLRAIKSDLFSKIKIKFDIIICNPPYLPEDEREDKESQKATTGGKKGDEFILKFISQSIKHINKGGITLLLLSSLTPHNKIISLIKNKNLNYKIIAEKKLFFETLQVWEIKNLNN